MDYYTWLYANKRKNLTPREDRGPINYSPIYLMYFVNIVFEIQYALIVSYMGKILEIINRILQQQFIRYKFHQFVKRILEEGKQISSGKLYTFNQISSNIIRLYIHININYTLLIKQLFLYFNSQIKKQ